MLPSDVLNRLETDKMLLAGVLAYHVISGYVYSSHLTNEMTATSLLFSNGKMIEIRFNIYNNETVTIIHNFSMMFQ